MASSSFSQSKGSDQVKALVKLGKQKKGEGRCRTASRTASCAQPSGRCPAIVDVTTIWGGEYPTNGWKPRGLHLPQAAKALVLCLVRANHTEKAVQGEELPHHAAGVHKRTTA
ncbi:hypothetical protein TraAM80_06894 [Trypanosoma rangeli]|uniref:Uncharacterized protein n=1 Tax=Trypanosoma rangeli TaxID=5698 RepID=A0A3S5IQQ4_TRYRA|nr:uncharacterized protein TraAM80_06894 [Trypanosoma rangeli]RNF01710.1 hypothetical protein TraAM80_06894 [Trypanosoma rangeli]|eukprot:RNF01710.1 hypothetical protein TraAM80_06894 [Trypanosoma rangeli]